MQGLEDQLHLCHAVTNNVAAAAGRHHPEVRLSKHRDEATGKKKVRQSQRNRKEWKALVWQTSDSETEL